MGDLRAFLTCSFTAAPAAGVAAQATAGTTKPRKVLHIAAGGGMFGILIAKALPMLDHRARLGDRAGGDARDSSA